MLQVGDLVKYMSRVLLVLAVDGEWASCVEVGEPAVIGRDKRSFLKVIK